MSEHVRARVSSALRDYETAWQELGLYLERGGGSDTDDDLAVRLLMDRLRMYLEFDVTQRADAEELFNEGM